MKFKDALTAHSYDTGLYDDDEDYFIVLPAKIWSHKPDHRNYVLVDIAHSANKEDPRWYDIFLLKGETTTYKHICYNYERKWWHNLVGVCCDSDKWQVWTLDDLFAYNRQELINDPIAQRGFIVVSEVRAHDPATSQ